MLGSVAIGAGDSPGRRGYEAYMEGRVLECRADKSRKILEEKSIRDGHFCKQMLTRGLRGVGSRA